MSGPTFVSNRLAELPAELNGPQGQAWARGMGAVQDRQLLVARVAALSRLPALCPDDALDLCGQWLTLPRLTGEANGTASPPTGYRGRIMAAFPTWVIAGSVGAIIASLNQYGLPNVEITGDIHWQRSWYTRFRVNINPPFGDFGWTTADPPTDQQKRDIRALILKWKWAYAYPVDVVFDTEPDQVSFFIGPLIGSGFIIGVNGIGGYSPAPGEEIPVSPPVPYSPIDVYPDFSQQELPENNDVLDFNQTWVNDVDIDSISNATPPVVTTASPNAFHTGDRVTLTETGVTALDATWTVTVLTSSTFSLNGGTASGAAGTGRAYATDLGTFTRLIDAGNWLARLAGVAFSTGFVSIQGRKKLSRPRVTLADASATVDTSRGDDFLLSSAPSLPRTITLRKTTAPIPQNGERMRFSAGKLSATGSQYTFTNEGGPSLCSFIGDASVPGVIVAEFLFAGGAWRLDMNSGIDTATPYGVQAI